MKQKNKVLRGKEGFEAYYKNLYGNRWDSLVASFSKENDPVEYIVPGAEKSYFLDSASVYAALCLPVKGAETILDLCAAPGGKTIVLASRMDSDCKLSANERSSDRKHRLDMSVQNCLPAEISERIITSCSDGSTWCTRQTECFDRILLDAPCSSERHVYLDSKYLDDWSPSRIKTVSMEQWALLSCAYRLLKTDGYLLYSTCALAVDENDKIIEKLMKKFNKSGDNVEIVIPAPDVSEIENFTNIKLPSINLSSWEKTEYGYQILPDVQNGAGPIFFTLIHKKNSVEL